MTISRKAAHALGMILVVLMWSATACSGEGEEPAQNVDGKIAPPSASMEWEQSRRATTDPAHIIRHYTAPVSPGTVRTFYLSELERRGWTELPGGDLSYAEWSRKGTKIVLIFEPPTADGRSVWSVLLYAAE